MKMHMNLVRHLFVISVAIASGASSAAAVDMHPLVLTSPIGGHQFQVVSIPPTRNSSGQGPDSLVELADMGADDDGCRHTSGATEYDYFLALDPKTYFTALIAEYDERTGRFRGTLTPQFKAWIDKEFNTQRQLDLNKGFQTATKIAKARGIPPPDRSTFSLSQADIPIERRYRYAFQCYAQRGARASALAKVALMGAWSLRCRANVPVAHTSLTGGYGEVNDRVMRKVDNGERFSLAKWRPIYGDIFENSRLTDEGYFVAGSTYFGMELREGNLAKCKKILDDLDERLKDNKDGDLMRGLVRSRRTLLREYTAFLANAADNFMRAIAGEEFPRSKLPETMLVVAESLRRQAILDNGGDALASRAMDWYFAIGKLPESQPKLREEMRQQGKAPGPDAPLEVQIAWLADDRYAKMTKAGVVHSGAIAGTDKNLLTYIVYDRLGFADFASPGWAPLSGANQADCAQLLDRTGKAVLDFTFRNETWPKHLGELWERGFVQDRNYLNRFHCPVTGKKFLYKQLDGTIETTRARTVIVATSEPVPTNQGPRYGLFLGNATIAWSINKVEPGQPYSP